MTGVAKKRTAAASAAGEKLMGASMRASAAEVARKQGAEASRVSALEAMGGAAEREEWLLDALSAAVAKGAREMSSAELRGQVASSLLQMMEMGVGVLGLLEREKGLKEGEVAMRRLENEVEMLKKNQQRLQADLAEERERCLFAERNVNALEGDHLTLVARVKDLEEDREESDEKVKELTELRDFWAEEGAELLVRKCLDSETFFRWFVEYSKLVRRVGYCAGVERVFAQCQERLGSYRIVEIKGYKILGGEAKDLIDQAYSMLQSGEIQFPILEALSSNPGLNIEQIRRIEELTEPGLGGPRTAQGVLISSGRKRSASGPPSGSEVSKKAKAGPDDVVVSSGSVAPAEVDEALDEGLTREEKEVLVETVEVAVGVGNVPEAAGGEVVEEHPPKMLELGVGTVLRLKCLKQKIL